MIVRVDTQQGQFSIAPTPVGLMDGTKEGTNVNKGERPANTSSSGGAANNDKRLPSMAELESAVKEIAQDLDVMQTKIAVRFDKESNTGVMEVIDRKTGKVIKQVPPEEILKIKKAFHNLVTGFLVDEQA
ncbi:MAG TPA: flagellar protein FlaG [Gammaproteobacteria bacterium]|nr:flagellar protein FlaG [Gammaproteobacteria bacterium]